MTGSKDWFKLHLTSSIDPPINPPLDRPMDFLLDPPTLKTFDLFCMMIMQPIITKMPNPKYSENKIQF